MNTPELLTLRADNWTEHLSNLAFRQALQPWAPRSAAETYVLLDPRSQANLVLAALQQDHTLAWHSDGLTSKDAVLCRESHALFVQIYKTAVHLQLVAASPDAHHILQSLLPRLASFRRPQGAEKNGVWATVSRRDNRGCIIERTYFLRCPTWDQIRANYPSSSRQALERLFALETPWTLGRLIIWHGAPGTGKTYALRALMMHWTDLFSFLVVTDPERLTSEPEYYFQLASNSSEQPDPRRPNPEFDGDDESEIHPEPPKRRFFILEDAADLILQKSRSACSDKIAKLLNMTDGLFGQGREDLFLVTFNEDIERIDPAFLRPGRCVARVEFSRFPTHEAAHWLRARGASTEGLHNETTLAELYALWNRIDPTLGVAQPPSGKTDALRPGS